MLQIEEGPRRGEYALTLRQRIPLWSDRTFLVALGVAALLHLAALGLFRVPAAALIPPERAIAPAFAIAELTHGPDSSAKALLVPEKRPWAHLHPPRSAPPPLPSVQLTTALIASTEQSLAPPPLPPLAPVTAHITYTLSGPLAEEQLLTPPPKGLSGLSNVDQNYRFRVQFDARQGRMLHVAAMETSSDQAARKRVESLVWSLRLQPRAHSPALIVGEVEVSVHAGDLL